MEDYFFNDNLKAVIFLVDSRHKLSKDDLSFFDFIKENDIPFVLVTTKIDKLNQSEKAKMQKNVKEIFGDISYFPVSINNKTSIEKLKERIVNLALG